MFYLWGRVLLSFIAYSRNELMNGEKLNELWKNDSVIFLILRLILYKFWELDLMLKPKPLKTTFHILSVILNSLSFYIKWERDRFFLMICIKILLIIINKVLVSEIVNTQKVQVIVAFTTLPLYCHCFQTISPPPKKNPYSI